MKEYKTVRGFLNLLHLVENHELDCLKGCDNLSDKEQMALGEIKAFIGNMLGEELSRFDKRKQLEAKEDGIRN